MGTPEFAVEGLKSLHENEFNIVAVITSPDKPAGRGQKTQESPVKKYAVQNGFKIMQPSNLKDKLFLEELSALQPDIQVVVAFRMLPESVWDLPKYGTLNLHASLLPHYRGAAPINHAIMNGETKTGLTTFFIEKEIDTGFIIKQMEIDILPDETAGELHDKLMYEGSKLLIDTVNLVITGQISPVSQKHMINENEIIKTANKIFKEDCLINWNYGVKKNYDFIRGLSPYPTARTILTDSNGKETLLKIYKTEMIFETHQLSPGTIQSDNKTFLRIAVSDGFINVTELQPEGKKMMKTNEWLNGFDISNNKVKM